MQLIIEQLVAKQGLAPAEVEGLLRRGLTPPEYWNFFRAYFLKALETGDAVPEVDSALRKAGHRLGPFQLWDAMGFEQTARRIENEGYTLPKSIHDMLWAQAKSFYRAADHAGQAGNEYFDLKTSVWRDVPPQPGVIVLADVKRARGVLDANAGASLIDLGDNILCCEFHSKMNTVNRDVLRMMRAGLAALETRFDAMVIANQGPVFSAGADLKMILAAAEAERWEELNDFLHEFQQVNMALKYAPKPVVAAPFGMTLGGGCEVVMHCAGVQAAENVDMALVEVGVGLVPSGGGCKEMLLRTGSARAAFRRIASATGHEPVGLRRGDRVSSDPERLIGDAKDLARFLAEGYTAAPPAKITVTGEAGFAELKMAVWTARESGSISAHDAFVGETLAHVLSGGRVTGKQEVSEQHLLDLEREALLKLAGTEKTRERMTNMLKTGKSFRN